ncbi:MAG: SPOR domain-containing protein [Candidatus Omnitrophica bacterium]|nr:SPOR domain-containing protein [Candidatus Omnitrophota bacterium]
MKTRRLSFFWVIVSFCCLVSEAWAFSPTGAATRRSRTERETRPAVLSERSSYDKVLELFLKEDYAGAARLSKDYTSNAKNTANLQDVLYLHSLSLFKLNRAGEARGKLSELEKVFKSPDEKAAAAASAGDSYFYDRNWAEALQSYQDTLNKYPRTDQTAYLRSRISEISGQLTRAVVQSPSLSQVAVEEKPFFTVQTGAFSKRRNAESFLKKLKADGYDAYLEHPDEHNVYRVRVGKFATRQEAVAKASRLNQDGYPTKVIP